MAGGIVRIWALALALGAGTQAVAARVVSLAGARQAIETPAVTTRDASLSALAVEGRSAELAARLDLIANDASLTDVAQEWLLDRGLHALARLAPSPAARATVARLTARKPIVYTRVDPDHGDRATPLYDTGATARFVLRNWERSAARTAAADDLAARDARVVSRFADTAADAARAGIGDAFRVAPLTEIAAQRTAVAAALAEGRRVDAIALILAERLADRDLFGLVIDHAEEREALAAVTAVTRALDASAALEALTRASRRADIASAAVLEAGRLATNDAAARRFLFEALDDPGIATSAAASLGALHDPAVSAEIGRRLSDARSDGERRLLVLALRLDMSPAARGELERFRRSGRGSPALQAKTRQLARAMSRTILAALLAGAALPAGAACIFDGNDEITNPVRHRLR